MGSDDEYCTSPKRRRTSKNARRGSPPSPSSSLAETEHRKIRKMEQYLPVVLSGNLGQRHRCLNTQVLQAVTDQVSFQDIENLPEQSPVDRLFKIDLANKLKDVDYILKNIKDDDIMYVSRALKCKWLLERRDIINPKYLEDVLFPEMVTPAVSKMRHWLYINLREPSMCQEFYQYYKHTKFDFAVKFLSHCSKEYIFHEFPNILTRITPHYLKVLGERDPKLVKIFFDSLATNNELAKRYLEKDKLFFKSIKCVLKLDPDIFLDILEKYHTGLLSPAATDFILRFYKSRLMAKAELYVMFYLHLPTVAKRLSEKECQDLLMRLARADYIKTWFRYENVEPLIKSIPENKRTGLKALLFVGKKVDDRVLEWPYALPISPVAKYLERNHVFDDQDSYPIVLVPKPYHEIIPTNYDLESDVECRLDTYLESKSDLEKLFDEFRCAGFEVTLHELKPRISAAESADKRREMFLVLVSKSKGRADAVADLLKFALTFRNDPIDDRAAVVRSLVKRVSAWRLPEYVWNVFMEYAHGLGLDGSESEAICREGLHAVVLRQLITKGELDAAVRSSFLNEFSTLAEYKLQTSERLAIANGLQHILPRAAAEAELHVAVMHLEHLFDVLEKYDIPLKYSQVISAVIALAKRDSEVTRTLLMRLYDARVARRDLFRQCLSFKHDDKALLNALRHDPDAITHHWLIKLLINDKTRANHFFLKLAVYFTETGGIAESIRYLLQEKIKQEAHVKLARPLATLVTSDMMSILLKQDVVGQERSKLSAALRANMHRARPAPDALTLGWRKAGVKAVAWRAMRCRSAQVSQLAQTLLAERTRRTVRLALILAQRTDCAVDLFSAAITIRPIAALRSALLYFRSHGEAVDLKIWDIVKPLLSTVDLASRKGLRHTLDNIHWVPKTIKPDYCAALYLALNKIGDSDTNSVVVNLIKYLPAVSDDLLDIVLIQTLENMNKDNVESFPAMVIRYLMLSKTDAEQEIRFDKIGKKFLDKVFAFRIGNGDDTDEEDRRNFFIKNIEQIITSLQYKAAFFNDKYQNCVSIMETVKSWLEKFLPKEKYFKHYIKIHVTMLYYKAVRQSIKQKSKVFEDPIKKRTEGVDIVGHTFGRYIAKELFKLKSKYFDSVIDLYGEALTEYLNNYIEYVSCRTEFATAIIKGILSESVGSEARVTIHLLECVNVMDLSLRHEIKELMLKHEANEMKFFIHADLVLA